MKNMPMTEKGKIVMEAMKKRYGKKKIFKSKGSSDYRMSVLEKKAKTA